MTAERFPPLAALAASDSQIPMRKGGVAGLSPADRAAIAARAAATLLYRANAAWDAPVARLSGAKAKDGGTVHDWASTDWLAESMTDTVGSYCLDSAMGPMEGDGFDFQDGAEGSSFDGGWLSGGGRYADQEGVPVPAADFGGFGGSGGCFGSSFEPGSLQADSFAVPDVRAAGQQHNSRAGLPIGFLSDTHFPLAVSPELPSGYGGLQTAAPAANHGASAAALRCNSCSDPARVPSMIVNVPVSNGSSGEQDACEQDEEEADAGGRDGRSQRLAARAARAARRAAAGSDDSDGNAGDKRVRQQDSDSNASSEYTPDSDGGDSAGGSSYVSGNTALASRAAPCAVGLMPAIGGGGGARASSRSGRHLTDAELKQQIAALQSRAAISCNPDQSTAAAARRECLLRYREKKLRRLDSNTIRYMKRKINADKRPRIKGRFVKAEELHLYHKGLLPGQDGIKPEYVVLTGSVDSGDK